MKFLTERNPSGVIHPIVELTDSNINDIVRALNYYEEAAKRELLFIFPQKTGGNAWWIDNGKKYEYIVSFYEFNDCGISKIGLDIVIDGQKFGRTAFPEDIGVKLFFNEKDADYMLAKSIISKHECK